MAHDEYGVVNWFIRKAIDGEVIPVFGDGRILRDFLFVDDAVECFIRVAHSPQAYGEVFNVGTGIPFSFIDLAKKIVRGCRNRESGPDGLHEGTERGGARRLLHRYLQDQAGGWMGTQGRSGRGPPKNDRILQDVQESVLVIIVRSSEFGVRSKNPELNSVDL